MPTPAKKPHSAPRPHSAEHSKFAENLHPNFLSVTPRRKPTKSPAAKPAKPKKPAPYAPLTTSSPSPAREKTTIAVASKKISCQVEKDSSFKKGIADKVPDEGKRSRGGGSENLNVVAEDVAAGNLEDSSKMRKMRRRMLEEAMSSVPEPGAGRVMYLVKTFERLLSINAKELEGGSGIEDSKPKVMNWALPGLQQQQPPPKAEVTQASYSFDDSSSSSELSPSGDYSRYSNEESSSVNSNEDRLSCGSTESDERGRNKRNSTGSSRRSWNKRLKVTSQQPFKLRTEQRGRFKEEHFISKVKEMLLEEEKKRIPMAQGLPWTTDEPECVVKPPVKQPTEPIDVVLHSDARAVERAEFDFHVTERINFVEQIKLERERQQKLEEEEETRRLRKELVPRAQPMPYFDRPFVPKRSTKPKTVPKDPKFHLRPMKEREVGG